MALALCYPGVATAEHHAKDAYMTETPPRATPVGTTAAGKQAAALLRLSSWCQALCVGVVSLLIFGAFPAEGWAELTRVKEPEAKAPKALSAAIQVLPTAVLRDSLGDASHYDTGPLRAAVEREFHPTAEQITADGKAQALTKQLTRAKVPSTGTGSLASAALEPIGKLADSDLVDAAQAAYEQPSNRSTVVIAAVISSEGQVVSIRVAESSGRAGFDDAAELAVQRGLREQPLRSLQSSVQLKIRLTGKRAVRLPNVGVAAGGRTFLPQARFQFEETTGKVRPQLRVPLSDVITTQIEVLSILPEVVAPEAAQ